MRVSHVSYMVLQHILSKLPLHINQHLNWHSSSEADGLPINNDVSVASYIRQSNISMSDGAVKIMVPHGNEQYCFLYHEWDGVLYAVERTWFPDGLPCTKTIWQKA